MDRGEHLDQIQEFQLRRLEHALAKRAYAVTPRSLLLIDSGIASLYLSCIDAGIGEEARSLIDSYRRGLVPQSTSGNG